MKDSIRLASRKDISLIQRYKDYWSENIYLQKIKIYSFKRLRYLMMKELTSDCN